MAAQTSDVISVLTHDHSEVHEMFSQLEADPHDVEKRRRITDDVIIELVRHSVAEEMYLYPAVRKLLSTGDEIADREIDDHSRIERTMKELEKTNAAGPEFSLLLDQLMAEVREHIRDEERNLFPQLSKHASAEELNELGAQVQAAKHRAPTRPHPSAPDRPPLNKLLAPGAGLVDRIRDHLSGRGH